MKKRLIQEYYTVSNLNWKSGKRRNKIKYTDLDKAKARQNSLIEQGFDARIELYKIYIID